MARDVARQRDSLHNHAATLGTTPKGNLALPWFAFAFIGVAAFNSLKWLPQQVIALTMEIDTSMLATAMVSLGLSTHFGAIRKAGSQTAPLGRLPVCAARRRRSGNQSVAARTIFAKLAS